MIGLRASVVCISNESERLSVGLPFQTEQAPCIGALESRSGVVGCAVQCAGSSRNVNRGVDGAIAPHMSRSASHVTRRHKPSRSDLTLQTQVPGLALRRLQVVTLRVKRSVGREGYVFVDLIREDVATRNVFPRIGQTARRTREDRAAAPWRRTRVGFPEVSRNVDVAVCI